MIRVLVLAVALTAAASAAMAQEVPYLAAGTPAAAAPAPTPPPPAPAMSPVEAEFEAKAQAFGARMQEMGLEMQAAITRAAGDAARQDADLDAIETRYQPDVEQFVTALEAFAAQQVAASPEAERAALRASLAQALPQIRSFTQQIRTQLEQAAAARPAS